MFNKYKNIITNFLTLIALFLLLLCVIKAQPVLRASLAAINEVGTTYISAFTGTDTSETSETNETSSQQTEEPQKSTATTQTVTLFSLHSDLAVLISVICLCLLKKFL